MEKKNLKNRKVDHLNLAKMAQISKISEGLDDRFFYEPIFSNHPTGIEFEEQSFLKKRVKAPLWISSMTGGSGSITSKINISLAKVAKKYGLGMALGSCRSLLDCDLTSKIWSEFDIRNIIGNKLPLYANLGIAQIEELLDRDNLKVVDNIIDRLQFDGLIIHINPIQEWLQPEGDLLKYPPIETIKKFLLQSSIPLIVKAVGQGFGPNSLKELLKLPLDAIELAGWGGTNFAKLEIIRSEAESKLKSKIEHEFNSRDLIRVGHNLEEMVDFILDIGQEDISNINVKNIIVSGGIKSSIDGYYYMERLKKLKNRNFSLLYGMAYPLLEAVNVSEKNLELFIDGELKVLSFAKKFLWIKK